MWQKTEEYPVWSPLPFRVVIHRPECLLYRPQTNSGSTTTTNMKTDTTICTSQLLTIQLQATYTLLYLLYPVWF